MGRPLIGQMLNRMGNLSAIDIDEILVEQAVTHRRFGEIALSWGLCDVEQLCQAWCDQWSWEDSGGNGGMLAPEEQALSSVPAELARRLLVLPLKLMGNQLIAAAARTLDSAEISELVRAVGHDVRLMRADVALVQQAIDAHYPCLAGVGAEA
jgi:hypothetical protein